MTYAPLSPGHRGDALAAAGRGGVTVPQLAFREAGAVHFLVAVGARDLPPPPLLPSHAGAVLAACLVQKVSQLVHCERGPRLRLAAGSAARQ